MRLDKFTNKFQVAISDAQSLALGRDNQYIEPVHLMSAMLNQQGTSIRPLFEHTGVNINSLRSMVNESIDKLPKIQGADADVQLGRDLIKLLNMCDKIAQKRKDDYITSEIFVLATVDDQGTLGSIFKKLGLQKASIEQAIEHVRNGQKVTDQNAEDVRQALEKYTTDLTERAEQGKLDPVIGRDDEIRRTVQVLQRRTKNNPVLIGEPGVGKTAIAEGLADRKADKEEAKATAEKEVPAEPKATEPKAEAAKEEKPADAEEEAVQEKPAAKKNVAEQEKKDKDDH